MRIHKKHGMLCAGVQGYKIYALNNQYRIVYRYSFLDTKTVDEFNTVTDYLNLKYLPQKNHHDIKLKFLEFASCAV